MMLWLRLKNYMIVLISTSCKRLNYSNIYTEFDGGKYFRRLIDLKFNETKHLKVRTHWAQSSTRGVCVHSGAIWNWSQQQRPPSCAWGGPPWLSGCQSGTATHNCSMQTLQKCAHSYYFQRSSELAGTQTEGVCCRLEMSCRARPPCLNLLHKMCPQKKRAE